MATTLLKRPESSFEAPRRKAKSGDAPRSASMANAVRGVQPVCDLAELGRQAKAHHERIVTREIEAAYDHWLLGGVLRKARPQVEKRKWLAWLEAHTLSRHRADRARLIARAFESPDELIGLTVEEALALAKCKRPPAAKKLAKKLRRRLREMAKSVRRTVDESASLGEERAGLSAAAQDVRQALDAALRGWDGARPSSTA